jgi:hypothetical protein
MKNQKLKAEINKLNSIHPKEFEKELDSQDLFTIDFGKVNLKSLILTNDATVYEKVKAQAQANIGVLFEPKVLGDIDPKKVPAIYLIGIQEDI